MDSGGGWQTVKRKKGKRLIRSGWAVAHEPSGSSEQGSPSEEDLEKMRQRVSSARHAIRSSKMWAHFKHMFSEVVPNGDSGGTFNCAVIYGLGGLSSFVSRYQLGFMLEMRDWLALDQVEAFDPVFTERDVLVLRQLGIEVLETNEQGARAAEGRTLVYMAHCEADLHENLILANCQADSLQNVVLIGNNLYKYKELFDCEVKPRYSEPVMLLKLCEQGRVSSYPLDELDLVETRAFNDTSLQTFCSIDSKRIC